MLCRLTTMAFYDAYNFFLGDSQGNTQMLCENYIVVDPILDATLYFQWESISVNAAIQQCSQAMSFCSLLHLE